MLIILEGTDGAGKTTIAARLHELIHERHPFHFIGRRSAGPPRRHPLQEWEVPLWRYRPGAGQHVILDRWHLGEKVYPSLLGRDCVMDQATDWHIELTLRTRGALLVHVTAEDAHVRRRVETRGDDLVTPAIAARARERFFDAFRETTLPHVVVSTDPGTSVDDQLRQVLDAAERLEWEYTPFDSFVTYVGPRQPKLLLVGDVRGVNGRWTHIPAPAFVPYASTSGHYLLTALRTRVQPWNLPIGLANACDQDNVRALHRALGEPQVVGLGRNAQRALVKAGVPHREAPHPQYWRRFRHREHATYADMIIEG